MRCPGRQDLRKKTGRCLELATNGKIKKKGGAKPNDGTESTMTSSMEMPAAIREQLYALEGNDVCADCPTKSPQVGACRPTE